MFEQSVILDHTTGKKTGALALSVTMQTAAVGVLLSIPLIYNDRLPAIHPWTPINFVPPLHPAPQVEPRRYQTAAHSPALTLSNLRVFTAPVRVSKTSAEPIIVDAGAPPIGGDAGPSSGPAMPFAPPTIHVDVVQPPPNPAVVPKPKPEPLRVGGDVQSAKLLKRVMPVYPALARQVRIEGTVRLAGVIAKDGTIEQLQLISGHPLLVQAALDAVRQWVYRPTMLNGEAVEVIAPIDVVFTLAR
jgi:protein TonB